MRLDKVWIVAKKDLAEFRTNKYIMFSLILMPLLMAVVLPVLYLSPFTIFSNNPSNQPLDLNLQTEGFPTVKGGDYSVVGFNDTKIIGADLNNTVLIRCDLEGCNITNALIRGCFVGNSTIYQSNIYDSNLQNTTHSSTSLSNSVIIGAQNENQAFLVQFINFLLLFFIMIPVIVPTVIASYSFVGEKLNKSLEPLLATPTTDLELLAGKSFSILLPSVVVTWLVFIPFVIIVDLLTANTLGYVPIPNLVWIIGVFILGPLFCIMSVALNVIVSSRVNDVRASQQLGSLIVLPVILFFVIALVGLFELNPVNMLLISGVVVLGDIGIFYASLKTFRREEILVRWK